MPAPVKLLDNMSKHLTDEERKAREEAERATLPQRAQAKLVMPRDVKGDRAARRYWELTAERMEGITLLDDLDSEALGILCSMLSRRDALNNLCRRMLADAGKEKDLEKRLEAVSQLDALQGKLSALEKTILQYQNTLGLTPSGRVRLMRKRAEARVEEPDGDLFGEN